MKILIVDDYTDVRSTLEDALVVLGYDARACTSHVAIDVARMLEPEVVLIEVALYTARLLLQIRTMLGSVIVIGMAKDLLIDTTEMNLAATVYKPFSIDELDAVLVEHAPRVPS